MDLDSTENCYATTKKPGACVISIHLSTSKRPLNLCTLHWNTSLGTSRTWNCLRTSGWQLRHWTYTLTRPKKYRHNEMRYMKLFVNSPHKATQWPGPTPSEIPGNAAKDTRQWPTVSIHMFIFHIYSINSKFVCASKLKQNILNEIQLCFHYYMRKLLNESLNVCILSAYYCTWVGSSKQCASPKQYTVSVI